MKEVSPPQTFFVYLRVSTGPAPVLQQPLTNATVQLYELDNPAPPGDDVLIPETGESEKITQKFDITEVRTYEPFADQLLGTGLTDQNGLVKFIAPTNVYGGTFQDIKTIKDVHTDQVISTHTVTRQVPEKKPDYGVTIVASDGTVIAQRKLIALNAPGNRLGTLDDPFPVRILTTIVTSDPSVPVSTPVTNARAWSSGIAPSAAGGWNYITEIYEPYHHQVPEWFVVHVPSGATHKFPGIQDVYANEHMQITNQLRAANGRIFFPCATNHIAYYEPVDEKIYQLPRIFDPVNGGTDNVIYKSVFGPDGKIYGATQSDYTPHGFYLPMVFQLDPVTLATRVLGHVGQNRLSYSYGYDVQVDPPWVYVAVGERPWELTALNIDTGEMKILATRAGSAPWIKLSTDTNAVIATLITNQGLPTHVEEKHYLADGVLYPYTAGQTTFPFVPRNVTPYSNVIENPVQIDDTDGAGNLSWRPYGSTDAVPWTDIHYTVNNLLPIPITSLAMLPDGSVIGDSLEYNGFWRYTPMTNTTTWYRASSGIISQPVLAVFDERLYIAGYPNGGLFAYDWTQPWSSKDRTNPINPRKLGEYHTTSKMKYARQLVWGANGRLYAAGHRERDGQGTGIGYFDESSGQFTGQFSHLNFLDPKGLVDIGGRIVFSGQVVNDPQYPGQTPTVAQLVTYDYDLNEISRTTVKDGALDTGQLFKISDTVVMGVVRSSKSAYLFDVSTATLLPPGMLDLGATPDAAIQRADGSVWLIVGRAITRIDPVTLARTTIGTLSAPASTMAWVGDDLYLSIGAELRVVRAVP